MSQVNPSLEKKLRLLFFIILFITAQSGFSADTKDLGSNAVLRGYGGASESSLVRLHLPASGIVSVDLLTSGPQHLPAKIELLATADAIVLEQSANHLTAAVREGATLRLRAAAEDPLLALGPYRIISSFVGAEVVEETFAPANGLLISRTSFRALDPAAKGDPEDVDPDPDSLTLAGGGRLLASVTTLRFSAPGVKGDPEDVDPDPDSLTSGGRGTAVEQVLFYEPTCRRSRGEEIDDHGDTAACATEIALGASVAGEIGNAYGDDSDVFELTLTELTTVEIATAGDADTFGVLYDRFGQRLAVADDTDGGLHFRIVATLAPGRYFVRIEGGGAGAGSYELTVNQLGR